MLSWKETNRITTTGKNKHILLYLGSGILFATDCNREMPRNCMIELYLLSLTLRIHSCWHLSFHFHVALSNCCSFLHPAEEVHNLAVTQKRYPPPEKQAEKTSFGIEKLNQPVVTFHVLNSLALILSSTIAFFSLWNALTSSSFSESYNFTSSRSKINKLDLISLSPLSLSLSSFSLCWGFV